MLADYPLVKLTSEASLSFSHATKTVKSLPDNIALIYKQLQKQITNSEFYAMAHGFDIKKQYWGRYQIEQTKSYHHQHYGIGGTGEYKQASMKRARTERASAGI